MDQLWLNIVVKDFISNKVKNKLNVYKVSTLLFRNIL